MAPLLEIRLFGTPSVRFNGRPAATRLAARCFPILALLAMQDHAVDRGTLAGIMWPEIGEADARANLRRHLHLIRSALPRLEGVEWLREERYGVIEWNWNAPLSIDVREFVKACETGDFSRAASLHANELLESCFDEAILDARKRLRGMYRTAVSNLFLDAQAEHDLPAVIRYAEQLLAVDPWDENVFRKLLAARYRNGDRAGAIAEYERFSSELAAELNAEPVAQTQALYTVIRNDWPLPADLGSFAVGDGGPHERLPFVGRAMHVERLRQMWRRSMQGNGGMAFVTGPAGIGKSRLASEFSAWAAQDYGLILWGETTAPEAEPFQALTRALRDALSLIAGAGLEPAHVARLRPLFPELEAISGQGSSEPADPERAREELHDAICAAVEAVARVQPLCLVLDDLHGAREATAGLMLALGRRVGLMRVLVIALYRTDPAELGPIHRVRRILVDESRATLMPVEPLSEAEIRSLVRSAIGDTDDRAVAEILVHSDGNPLFVEQFVGGRASNARADLAKDVASLADAIRRRLSALGEEERYLGQVAAIAGEAFRLDVLSEVTGWDETAIQVQLERLMDHGFARQGNSALRFRFAHPMYAELFAESLPQSSRPLVHRRLASALSRLTSIAPAELAGHWAEAGEKGRAAALLLFAAQAAQSVYARDECIEFAERAIALSDDEDLRFDARLVIAQVLSGAADVERWRTAVDELCAQAEGLSDYRRCLALEQRAALAHDTGATDVETLATEFLSEALKTQDPTMIARASLRRARVAMNTGNTELAITLLRDGIARLADDDSNMLLATVRAFLASSLARSGGAKDEVTDLLNASIPVLRKGGSPDVLQVALRSLANIAQLRRDYDAMAGVAAELRALAHKSGDIRSLGKAELFLGLAAGGVFDMKRLRAHAAKAREAFAKLGNSLEVVTVLLNWAMYEARIGQWQRNLEMFGEIERVADSETLSAQGVFARVNRCDAYLSQGDSASALFWATEALTYPLGTDGSKAYALAMHGIADAVHHHTPAGLARARTGLESLWEFSLEQDSIYPLAWYVLVSSTMQPADKTSVELLAWLTDREHYIGTPALEHYALMKHYEAVGDADAAAHWRAFGRSVLKKVARKLSRADAAALTAMFYNAALLKGARA